MSPIRLSRPVRLLALSILLPALSACSMSISVAGRTEDYSEVFFGEGVGDGITSNYTVVLEPSGVNCSVKGKVVDLLGHWHDTIACNDGRTGTWDSYTVGLGIGDGQGQLSDGKRIFISGGLKGYAEKMIAEFRQAMTARWPSAPALAAAPPRAATSRVPPPAEAAPPRRPSPASVAAVPVVPRFPRGPERPDDVAVIIGNGDYGRLGKDIPDVRPAHADAEGARLYATQALGIKEGNVILLKDATSAQLTRVFGSDKEPRGQLFDWVKPGRSRVYVYYSGHGAPASQGGSPYLVPTDADAARIELNGYPVKQLYDNLGKLPAESVTVVLEACFSGVSPAGSVLGKASPVFFEVKAPPVPPNLTVIAAGAANQMASWETDESSGLFTKYYLKAMAGEADADKDGRVSLSELERYLKDTLTYYARRHYGRDQQAQIVKGGGR